MFYELVVYDKETKSELTKIQLEEDQIYTVGRSDINNIHIPHSTISKNHLSIQVKAGKVFLTDLNSSNGTYIDGIQIQSNIEIEFKHLRFPIVCGDSIKVIYINKKFSIRKSSSNSERNNNKLVRNNPERMKKGNEFYNFKNRSISNNSNKSKFQSRSRSRNRNRIRKRSREIRNRRSIETSNHNSHYDEKGKYYDNEIREKFRFEKNEKKGNYEKYHIKNKYHRKIIP